ncbi:MAG TPA: site-2 protease family protein [Candidatus Lustribacter sp.]|jgi:Zn-dependent protease/predicted transcriptional regulator|nr:site-2 protease family protein [Candidatus Lustribacter sp.]
MRIGQIFGVTIVVDVSWLFIFAIVSWALGSSAGPFHAVQVTPGVRALLAIVTALLFFVSVLLHELAHSLVARAQGIPVREIRLFIFGGASNLTAEPKSPGAGAWLAFAGPLMSLVLAVLCALVAAQLGMTSAAGIVFAYLASANAIVGVFNLLPAFPMDGGRILQSVIWAITHDRMRATRIAGRIGMVFAWLTIAYGITDVLLQGFGGGLWFTFIGWFLLLSAQGEERQARLQVALRGHSAVQLAAPAAATLAADTHADTALKLMLNKGVRALPVVLGERFVGLVTLGDFAQFDGHALENTYVTAVMKRADDVTTIAPSADAAQALAILGKTGFHQLPVVDDEGMFLGFVTREGVIDWLAHQREPQVQAALRHP